MSEAVVWRCATLVASLLITQVPQLGALLPTFLGKGFPTRIDRQNRKKIGSPYSNLSTEGPHWFCPSRGIHKSASTTTPRSPAFNFGLKLLDSSGLSPLSHICRRIDLGVPKKVGDFKTFKTFKTFSPFKKILQNQDLRISRTNQPISNPKPQKIHSPQIHSPQTQKTNPPISRGNACLTAPLTASR